VPLCGSVTVEDDFGRTTAHPGGALLAPVGKRVTRVEGAGSEPFVGVPVLIPANSIGHRLRAFGLDRTIAINGSRSAVHAEAIRLVMFLHDEFRNGAGLLRRPKAAASHSELLKDIIGDLLTLADAPARTHGVASSVAVRRVRAAEDFMLANLSEILTVADVARELGLSVRTLELAFRSVHDVSPHRYLASLRLAVSRRLLLSDPDVNSVTETCLACGIGHAGRFATAYRQRFGETPSETLRRR
jgi:AraC-like DNA-binding protein